MEGKRISRAESNVDEHVPRITDQEFFRQYREEKSIKLPSAELFYHTAEPLDPITDRWVVYLGGLGTNSEVYEDELLNLAQSGRKVLYSNPLHGLEETTDPAMDELGIPDTLQHKASAVAKIIDELSLGPIDMVGHSQGGAVAVSLELMRPGSIRQLVLECPAGMNEQSDSVIDITKRTVLDIAQQVKRIWKLAPEENKLSCFLEKGEELVESFVEEVLLHDPLWRLKEEIPSIVDFDLIKPLTELHQRRVQSQQQGSVILITAHSDLLFSEESIAHKLGFGPATQTGPYEQIDRWLTYANPEAGHNAPIIELPGLLPQVLNEGLEEERKSKDNHG